MMLTTHKTHIFFLKKTCSYQTLNCLFTFEKICYQKHDTKQIFCIMSTLRIFSQHFLNCNFHIILKIDIQSECGLNFQAYIALSEQMVGLNFLANIKCMLFVLHSLLQKLLELHAQDHVKNQALALFKFLEFLYQSLSLSGILYA